MEVTQFPSDGLQEEQQGEGHHNSSQPLPPLSTKQMEHRLPNNPGSSGKLPQATFPHREQTRSHVYTHSFCTHETKSKVSQTITFTVRTQKAATLCRTGRPDYQAERGSSVVVYSLHPRRSTVHSQKASVLLTGKLLHCTVLLAVLQVVGISRKCLENILKT